MPQYVKRYIGDGVYVTYEYNDVVLTTEDGISVTNRIVLEPNVMVLFNDYLNTPLKDLELSGSGVGRG